ncbi:MAG: Flp family type IVb pilin [Myxococcota bacterium]
MLHRFWRDDSGATAIEYALIASFVAMLIVSGLLALEDPLSKVFVTVAAAL